MCQLSHVLCHVSHVTSQVSYVTSILFIFIFNFCCLANWCRYLLEELISTGPIPFSLLRETLNLSMYSLKFKNSMSILHFYTAGDQVMTKCTGCCGSDSNDSSESDSRESCDGSGSNSR